MIGTSQAKRRWIASRLHADKKATTAGGVAPERNIAAASGIETKGPAGVTMPAAEANRSPFQPESSPNAIETHSRGIRVSARPATKNEMKITAP